jgi:hypothetical protein
MKLLGLRGNLKLASFIVKYVLFGHRFPAYRIVRDIPEYDNVPATEIWPAPADAPIRDYILTTMGVAETGGMPEWMSLYHYIHALRSTMFSSFFSLTGGVASLADELAKRLPVQYEAPVRQLVVEKGRVVGVEMEDGSAKKADHVMVAVAPPAAARHLDRPRLSGPTSNRSSAPKPMPVFFLDRPLNKACGAISVGFGDRSCSRWMKLRARRWYPAKKSVLTAFGRT